ncbi:uncharacterized protein [Drosophila takahashii]|uniref:uncharacterized protein n=1 Tax=Drosophila takahashii TaxID=29030 RepID=UPI0038993B3D
MISSSIDQLLADQLELGERIQSIIRNYKKDSRKRKSKPGYFKDRLTKLELLWDTFFTAANQIQTAIQGMPVEHKYFENNVFMETENSIIEWKAEFNKNPNVLENDTTPGSPIKGDNKLESIPRDQKVLLDRMDILMNQIIADSKRGVKRVTLPYWSEMKNMHEQICKNYN